MAVTPPPCFGMFFGMHMDVVRNIRMGIPVSLADDVAKFMGLRLEMLAVFLGFSVPDLAQRIQGHETLQSWEAGRLFWVAHAYVEAAAVFESEQGAVEWLRERVMALGNVAPLSLLDSPAGYQLVLDTLGQIKYGVYA